MARREISQNRKTSENGFWMNGPKDEQDFDQPLVLVQNEAPPAVERVATPLPPLPERDNSADALTPSSIDVDDYTPVPPDGGWGWVVVAASFLANVIVDGICYSVGIFFKDFKADFHGTQAQTAMVGSLLSGVCLLVGPIVSGLVNRFGARLVMMSGAVTVAIGFVLSSFASSLPMMMVTYGVIGGIGFGLIYLPAIVQCGYYFEKKRALATGISVSGSGIGTFLFAPFSVWLLTEYNWRAAVWIMAGFALNCAVFGALMRPLKPKKDPQKLHEELMEQERNLRETLTKLCNLKSISESQLQYNPPPIGRSPKISLTQDPNRPPKSALYKRRASLGVAELEKYAQIRSTIQKQVSRETSMSSSTNNTKREESAVLADKLAASRENSAHSGRENYLHRDSSSTAQSRTEHWSNQKKSHPSRESSYQSGPRSGAAMQSHHSGGRKRDTSRESSRATGGGYNRYQKRTRRMTVDLGHVRGDRMVRSTPGKLGGMASLGARRKTVRYQSNKISAQRLGVSLNHLYSIESGGSGGPGGGRPGGVNVMSAAQSLFGLSGIDPRDLSKPLYRRDAFFIGSINRLPDYVARDNRRNSTAYRKTQILIPHSVVYSDAIGANVSKTDESEGWIPDSIKNVVSEMIDVDLLLLPEMLLLFLSNIFGTLGFYVPFFFLADQAESVGVTRSNASYLLSIIGIANTVGRIFFGVLADQPWITALTINNLALLFCGAITCLVPFLTSFAALVVYSVLFGFVVSSYISLTSVILVDLLSLDNLTNSFGLVILSRGITAIFGSPLAGIVYDATGTYDASFYLSGGLLVVAGVISCAIPVYKQYFEEDNDDDSCSDDDDEADCDNEDDDGNDGDCDTSYRNTSRKSSDLGRSMSHTHSFLLRPIQDESDNFREVYESNSRRMSDVSDKGVYLHTIPEWTGSDAHDASDSNASGVGERDKTVEMKMDLLDVAELEAIEEARPSSADGRIQTCQGEMIPEAEQGNPEFPKGKGP